MDIWAISNITYNVSTICILINISYFYEIICIFSTYFHFVLLFGFLFIFEILFTTYFMIQHHLDTKTRQEHQEKTIDQYILCIKCKNPRQNTSKTIQPHKRRIMHHHWCILSSNVRKCQPIKIINVTYYINKV